MISNILVPKGIAPLDFQVTSSPLLEFQDYNLTHKPVPVWGRITQWINQICPAVGTSWWQNPLFVMGVFLGGKYHEIPMESDEYHLILLFQRRWSMD